MSEAVSFHSPGDFVDAVFEPRELVAVVVLPELEGRDVVVLEDAGRVWVLHPVTGKPKNFVVVKGTNCVQSISCLRGRAEEGAYRAFL